MFTKESKLEQTEVPFNYKKGKMLVVLQPEESPRLPQPASRIH